MALGRLGKQTVDALGDYFLKSRKAVEESGVGRTEAKPAGTFLKEMQRRGVPEEEVRDLGLDQFDPKGARANERLTNEQMLSLIDERRERLEGSEVSLRQALDEPITEPSRIQDMGDSKYGKFVAEVGNPDDYEELVVTKGRKPKLINSSSETSSRGLHYPLEDQIFHLRLNRAKSDEGEGVTNLLELQSDIQQRAQKGEPLESDPKLPMKDNWEKLGMKEAIKYAVAKGDRYLAIPPSDETAMAVGARIKVDTSAQYKIKKKEDGYTLESSGYTFPHREYEEIRFSGDFEDTVEMNMDTVLDTDLLNDAGLITEVDGQLTNITDAVATEYFDRRMRELADFSIQSTEVKKKYMEIAERNWNEFVQTLDPEDQMSFDEFIEEIVLSDNARNFLNDLERTAQEMPIAVTELEGRTLPAKDLSKMTGLSESQLKKAEAENTPVSVEAGQFGGEGIMDFYDRKIVTEKRLKEYGVPLVEIVQIRPDGTKVKTKALDLKKYEGKKPKDIPYSLYSVAGGLLTGTGAVMGLSDQQEEPQMFAEGGFVNEEDGMKEAPVGALNEEVADDVDARLSEGEFVIPADVVRYIGLDKLMQMRQEAKAGLAQMEQMGQMGNAEEAVLPDNIPHQTMDDKLSFAQGGFVGYNPTTQAGGTSNILPSTSSIYSPQQFQTVQPAQAPVLTPQQPTAPTTGGGYEMRTYRGPNGDVIYVPFMGGQPLIGIPTGYVQIARSEATQPATPDTPATPTVPPTGGPISGGSSGGDSGDDGSTGGDTGTGTTGTGVGGQASGKDTSIIDEAFEEFLRKNPDYEPDTDKYRKLKEDIESGQTRTAGATLGSAVMSGIGGAIMSLIKGGSKLSKMEEERLDAIRGSDAFEAYLNQNVFGQIGEGTKLEELVRTGGAGDMQEQSSLGKLLGLREKRLLPSTAGVLSALERSKEDKSKLGKGTTSALLEKRRYENEQKKRDQKIAQEKREAQERAEARALAARREAAASASDASGGSSSGVTRALGRVNQPGFVGSGSSSDGSSYNPNTGGGYSPSSSSSGSTSGGNWSSASSVGSGGGNASRGYSYGGWKKGGLITRRKK